MSYNFTNCRLISVVPSFSKFLESAVFSRSMQYLPNFNILCSNQYDFRKNHSTAFTWIDLYNKISTAFVDIFLDLSKAFHIANYAPFYRLGHYGIRGLALDWTYPASRGYIFAV